MLAILSRVRLNLRQVIVMVVFVAIASAAQMVSPTLVSMIIDSVSDNNQSIIIYLAIAMLVLSLVACATNVVATKLAATISTKTRRRPRSPASRLRSLACSCPP